MNNDLEEDLTWMDKGLCKTYPVKVFFPSRGDTKGFMHAKSICLRCPVKDQCLGYALRNPWLHGIWGGAGERTRMRMRGLKR